MSSELYQFHEDLCKNPCEADQTLHRVADTTLPTSYGHFRLIGYELNQQHNKEECMVLVMGELADDILVRIHSQCLTGDVFGSLRCDCGPQLDLALSRISDNRSGIIIYHPHHEGRGIGLLHKIRAYKLQDEGLNTVEANQQLGFPDDMRDYTMSGLILRDLGIHSVRLMTNNPAKCAGLEEHGIVVSQRVPLIIEPNEANRNYLMTKQCMFNHSLGLS